LFTLIGLNLAGCSSLATCCPAAWPACRPKPDGRFVLSGVLATAIATHRAFHGASLGYAVGLPAAQALAILAGLAGMALPHHASVPVVVC
jgi:thiol:disulfide interchange protein DsbD